MRPGINIAMTAADRDQLTAVIADRNSPQKHIWRAAIVLATADGLGTNTVLRVTCKGNTAVWRWQERFAATAWTGCFAQDPSLAHRAIWPRGERADRRSDARRAVGRDDPVDRAGHSNATGVSIS